MSDAAIAGGAGNFAKVKALAVELGANPSVTEQVYRAMISCFIDAELAEHAA
jgi:isochorismate pyruvate lyase